MLILRPYKNCVRSANAHSAALHRLRPSIPLSDVTYCGPGNLEVCKTFAIIAAQNSRQERSDEGKYLEYS